jgi:hypothetical protein
MAQWPHERQASLRPQQTSAKGVRVCCSGAPRPDRSSRVGNGIVEPHFVVRASLQSVELLAEWLRNADGSIKAVFRNWSRSLRSRISRSSNIADARRFSMVIA